MAHSLLLRTSFDIGTIAKKCGFENANYFSRLFKKYLKLTPTEYRETEAKKPQIKGDKPTLNYIEIDLSIENGGKHPEKS
jgi:AraC-like DNA-binding protein